ncbi:GPCR kinase [Tanacetum coccineum]
MPDGTDNQEKDEKQSQNDKTGLGMEKTVKDKAKSKPESTIPGTIHHKVVDDGGYGKDITVRAALILANVLVFSPKPSMHYLSITMRNVFKVFRKDTVSRSGSG